MFSKIKKETLRKLKVKSAKREKSEKISKPPSRLSSTPLPQSGIVKLSQDIATLVNNPQDSDIQFKVGGGDISSLHENGEPTYDESRTVTLYAHSLILRCRSPYFAAMLDKDMKWKESFNGIIYKPNISPSTFRDILHYIYTGDTHANNSENIIDLITAADEMSLEELSTACQTELIRTAKRIFLGEDGSDDINESGENLEGLTRKQIPTDVAIHTHIIPALNLASSHSLSHLSQELQAIIPPHISVIINSPNTYATFINEISSEALFEFISSDNLAMTESSIWDLVFDWACHQTKLEKTMVEECLCNFEDDEKDDDEDDDENDDENDDEESSNETKLISSSQLKQLKTTLTPLLPAIRFSLFGPDDYARMMYTISYFLPRRRILELQQHFMKTNSTGQLDLPRKRMEITEPIISKVITDPVTWKLLRKNIFETGGIAECSFLDHLKFELLFRSSEHGLLEKAFHQRCDDKGPTLVLVRSSDGYLFGGVNFSHWKSDNTWSSSPLNLLFTLPDGHHRDNSVFYRIKRTSSKSSGNFASHGPVFGDNDFYIARSQCGSLFPASFDGNGGLNSTLAGAQTVTISDYEVFAISK